MKLSANFTFHFQEVFMFKIIYSSVIIVLTLMFCNSVLAAKTYTVKSGDSLSRIAQKCYGRGHSHKWPHIYRANKNVIKDQRLLQIGWKLVIPALDQIPPPEEDDPYVIKLVTGNNYAPYSDEKLPNNGMITEIVERVFKKMGFQIKTEFWAWKHGFDAAEELEFDASFPWLKNPKRMEKFRYSKSLYNILIRCFVKEGASITYNRNEDFQGKTFCRPKGWYMHDIQDLLDRRIITVKRPEDINTCFKMLKNGDVDVVPANEFVAWASINKTFDTYEGFRVLDKVLSTDTLHLIISKRHPDGKKLMEQFEEAVKKLKEEGRFQKIVTNHIKNYRIFNKIPE